VRKLQSGWLIVACYGGLAALLAASGFRLVHNRSAAYAAQKNLEDCRQLAAQIDVLKGAPAQASLEQRTQKDLSRKIEQTAQIAEIPASAIISISPQAGRRLGTSALSALPTNLQVRDVSLKQLVRFLVELSADDSGLQATSLRLTAPRTVPPKEAEERWSAEMVLTYLVFSPEYAPTHSGESRKDVSK